MVGIAFINIWKSAKKHKRLIFNVLGILFIFWYNFHHINPQSANHSKLAAHWIKCGLWLNMIVSGSVFFIFFVDVVKTLMKEGEIILLLPDKSQRTKKISGVIIGLVVSVSLLVFLLTLGQRWPASHLAFISIIFTFLVFVMDLLLETDGIALNLDLPVLITLILIVIFYRIYSYIKPSDSQFIVGFLSGSTAFQLVLANLLFDPSNYSIERIFKKDKEELIK